MAELDLNSQINWEDVQEDYAGLAGELDYDLELVVSDEGTLSLLTAVHIFVGVLVSDVYAEAEPPRVLELGEGNQSAGHREHVLEVGEGSGSVPSRLGLVGGVASQLGVASRGHGEGHGRGDAGCGDAAVAAKTPAAETPATVMDTGHAGREDAGRGRGDAGHGHGHAGCGDAGCGHGWRGRGRAGIGGEVRRWEAGADRGEQGGGEKRR